MHTFSPVVESSIELKLMTAGSSYLSWATCYNEHSQGPKKTLKKYFSLIRAPGPIQSLSCHFCCCCIFQPFQVFGASLQWATPGFSATFLREVAMKSDQLWASLLLIMGELAGGGSTPLPPPPTPQPPMTRNVNPPSKKLYCIVWGPPKKNIYTFLHPQQNNVLDPPKKIFFIVLYFFLFFFGLAPKN